MGDIRCRIAVAAALVIGLAALPAVWSRGDAHAATRTVDGRVDDWRGASTGLGGTWQLSAGELVYQDHLFDDLGADTGARSKQHGTFSPPTGDFRYPTNAEYADNAADLLELRLAADSHDVWLLARMSTLRVVDRTVVAVGIDLDPTAPAGGGAWPHGAGLSVPGVDVVITMWGTGGSITRVPDGAPEPLADVAASTDNAHNAIEARIPREVLAAPGPIRVWAASGLWDRDASTWMPVPAEAPSDGTPGGGGADVAARAFNVAFRADDHGSFMEDEQATALASGNIERFHADVDLALLAGRRDDPYEVTPGRFYSVIVDEGVSLPPPFDEGLSYDGVPGRFRGVGGRALAQTFDFFGRHQPYGLYVPSTHDGTTPLPAAFVLHGLGGSHSSFNANPGFIRDMGEGIGTDQPPMYLITPLARGSSFYADWGEADTLAVLADALGRVPIDEERLYLTGYSMGGYGVYRLASLYPDRFAAAAVWAGYTGEVTGSYLIPTGGGGTQGRAVIGVPVDTLENLRHLPLVHLMGTNDEIVPTSGQYAAPRRLAELGYRSRLDVYPGYEHLTFAIVDDWKQVRSWLGDQRRARTPREVTYRFSDGWTEPGLADQLGLVHGNAWWLRQLTMRESTDDGRVLASAHAVSHGVPANAIEVQRTDSTATAPTPHVQRLVAWDERAPLPVENALDLDLAGVGSATVVLEDAGLDGCGLTIRLISDGRVAVRLAGKVSRHARVVGLGGVTSRTEDGAVVIDVAEPVDGIAMIDCTASG